jgi:putative glutamine amidotransferase
MLQACSGLLLVGGGDLEAYRYGAPDSGKLTYVSPERDRIELQFTHWALEAGLPILGICRGIQTLNVAAGGTLVQDIPSEIESALGHQSQQAKAHTVQVVPGSLLSRCVGTSGTLQVNSRHHQAVARVANGFAVSAIAADGITEAIELPGVRFTLGVQWHPESLVPGDEAAVVLFRSFVEACSET